MKWYGVSDGELYLMVQQQSPKAHSQLNQSGGGGQQYFTLGVDAKKQHMVSRGCFPDMFPQTAQIVRTASAVWRWGTKTSVIDSVMVKYGLSLFQMCSDIYPSSSSNIIAWNTELLTFNV